MSNMKDKQCSRHENVIHFTIAFVQKSAKQCGLTHVLPAGASHTKRMVSNQMCFTCKTIYGLIVSCQSNWCSNAEPKNYDTDGCFNYQV